MTNIKTSRSKTRKFLFQYLFASVYSKVDLENFKSSFFYRDKDYFDYNYFDEIKELIISKESTLIHIIEKYAPKFDIKNMHVEYIIPIYIGATEMLFLTEEIPGRVSINEAIEITKIFAEDGGKKIVNGVLDSILKNFDDIKKEISYIENPSDFSIFTKY